MANLILFDIDRTLIDTTKLVQELYLPALSQHLEVNHQEFLKVSREYWDQLEDTTDFNPEEYVLFIIKRYGGEPQELLSIIFAPEFYRQSLFLDVEPTLVALASNYTLGIFSQGNEIYQQQKLELSGIKHWFDEKYIYFLQRKLEVAILEKLPEAVIVDDKPEVVQTLNDYSQILPIWLNRKDDTQIPGTPTIHRLTDITTFL